MARATSDTVPVRANLVGLGTLQLSCPYALVLDFSEIKCCCERCYGLQVTMRALRSPRCRAFILSQRMPDYSPSTARVRAYLAGLNTM